LKYIILRINKSQKKLNMKLLQEMCAIHAPSGNESAMTQFLLSYINDNKNKWKTQPQVFYGEDFQDSIVLIFGKPRTAIFAHIDNIGFTVRYRNQLVKIGGPQLKNGTLLRGTDSKGHIECEVLIDTEERIMYKASREIDRGTDLSFVPNWIEDEEYVQCCYMDNRLGVWNALKVCETLDDGAIVFSCREEHGGGSVGYLLKFLYENYKIKQTLISDITWITEGVLPGKGVVISMRDIGIPRRTYLNKIIRLAESSHIPFQLEVEGSGGSDGTEIQKQNLPVDWCFVGAAEQHVHSPKEKVNKADISHMLNMYKYLMKNL